MKVILVKIAIRDLSPRRGRAILTVLGVAIGVAVVIALLAIGYGLEDSIKETLNSLIGSGFVVVPQGITSSVFSGGIIPGKVAVEIERVDGVETVIPVLVEMGFTEETGSNAFLVVGVPVDKAEKALPKVVDGRFWRSRRDRRTAVLGSALAKVLSVEVGDKLEIYRTPYDREGVEVTVIGVMSSTGVFVEDQAVYLPLETVQKAYSEEDKISAVFVKVKAENADAVRKELLKEFPDYMIIENEEIIENVENILNVVRGTLLGIGGISTVIGGLSVMNSIMIAVNEKIRDIGILRTIGASKKQVLLLFLLEGVVYAVLGGALGLAIGIGLSKLIAKILAAKGFPILLCFSVKTFGLGCSLAFIVGVGASLYPSLKAANLRVVEAIRHV